MTSFHYTIIFSFFGAASLLACVDDHADDCDLWKMCPSEGGASGDGDTGGGNPSSGGGDGTGGGDTGGTGGLSDPCDSCEGDTPACNAEAECVQCTTDDKKSCVDDTPHCNSAEGKCVECLENTDCPELTAAHCDGGACGACGSDEDCTRFSDTPVCDGNSGACVECTADTEVAECGEFSCSSLTNTCTTTKRGLLDTCDSCEADSECATDRKCVMDQFEGEDVGYFCFLEQGTTGCGNVDLTRRPYSTPAELKSLDGASPQIFCLPPAKTTCQGIRDTRNVVCTTDDDCGMDGENDGYCPLIGDGALACSYRCTGGFECTDGLECTGSPQHCNPE